MCVFAAAGGAPAWLQDRALVLRGTKAFVSYVRAYKEHQLSYLLPFEELDLGSVATAMALLRLPRMKEIVGRRIGNFEQSDVDPLHIPFLYDSERERARQICLQEAMARRESVKRQKHTQQLQQQKKQRRKERRELLFGKERRTRAEKRRVKRRNALEEWEELAFEERMAKKLRKRKITVEEYDRRVERALESDDSTGCTEGNKDSLDSSTENESEDDDGERDGSKLVGSDAETGSSEDEETEKKAGAEREQMQNLKHSVPRWARPKGRKTRARRSRARG